MTPHKYKLALAATLIFGLVGESLLAQQDDWVARSDQASDLYLDILARYNPETAGFLGIEGLDEEVFSLPDDLTERSNADVAKILVDLRERLAKEAHPAVRQDLEILIASGEESIEQSEINDRYMLPYFNLAQTIFQGLRNLLDDQVDAERRPAALTRLARYAGLEEGYTPLTEQAIAYTRKRLKNPELLGPFKAELERDIGNAPRFIGGLAQLFEKYELEGWQEAHAELSKQLDAYHEFLQTELGPRTRDDYRLPEEVYASNLKGFGVNLPVEELISRAKVAFREIQNEMQAIAVQLAKQEELPSSDYRDVIRELKKDQLVGEEILPHYEERIAQLEKLIVEHRIVTLPDRPMRIRLASEAESAASPAPSMRPPRLIGNTGEMGEFVLPLSIPGEDGDLQLDDFTFTASSWTLAVHEGRPGHELQFASMVEKGISKARGLFAFNSTNVEGWALYAEAEMKPYLPLEGQMISLQHRLLRAARAYLDPSLQLGTVTPEEVQRILEEQVVLSNAAATSEVQRYTFRAPGQATSYFTGYQRLMELRTDVERIVGNDFDKLAFHDFVLSQGLLPPDLLRAAVMTDFVGAAQVSEDAEDAEDTEDPVVSADSAGS